MGREESAKRIIWIGIYFLFISLVFTGVQSFSSVYGFNTGNISTSGGFDINSNTYQCSQIRFGETKDNDDISPDPLLDNGYITNEFTCESYKGFIWSNSTDYFWGLYTSSASCGGYLNLTYYNNGTFTGNTFLNYNLDRPISDLHLVNTSKFQCEHLGFVWEKPDNVQNVDGEGTDGFFSTFGKIITFRFSFSTQFITLNWLLNILFVLVPLIILGFDIYIMLPFIGQ